MKKSDKTFFMICFAVLLGVILGAMLVKVTRNAPQQETAQQAPAAAAAREQAERRLAAAEAERTRQQTPQPATLTPALAEELQKRSQPFSIAAQPSAEPNRFRQTVQFTPDSSPRTSRAWTRGSAGNIPVFRSEITDLVWSDALEKPTFHGLTHDQLKGAMATCAALEPEGAWFLPLVAEVEDAEKDGLRAIDLNGARQWLVYNYIDNRFPAAAARVWDGKRGPRPYHIRCVARSERKE